MDQNPQPYHWADYAALQVIKEFPDEEVYTVASGVTPSGMVHVGHFRELITSELVRRSLERLGKKTRFIYSWDSYDAFRKVPSNVPESWKQYLRLPNAQVPDPFGECHESYAEHWMQLAEQTLRVFNFPVEYQRQHKIQTSGEYAEDIRKYLRKRKEIKKILDKFRKEPLPESWFPLTVYSEKTGKDTTKVLSYDEEYTIEYECEETGFRNTIDFRKTPIVKLPWRLDWPMRWAHYGVCYEPGGKDHSTPGGSYDTGKQIVKLVSNRKAPVYTFYNFVGMKGSGGKISSSSGKGATMKDLLEVYTPELVMYLFVGTRPQAEFSISFDTDVIKIYEDYDKLERQYYGIEKVKDEKKLNQYKRIYELCQIKDIQPSIPYQPGFRHLTTIIQIHEGEVEKVIEYFASQLQNDFDKQRLLERARCAKNWLDHHASEEFIFKVRKPGPVDIPQEYKEVLHQVAQKLDEREWDEISLHEELYILIKNANLDIKEFFQAAYKVLIGKDRGPKLASFILTIGKQRAKELLLSC
ncbi:lysine--tRNA ligase [Candidatus Woesearchaeota archaeon]|nr:MAG: lysine--tRNA ligase [Candidatus Woesearchaeota archaeon]